VWSMARRFSADRNDTEDAVQEVFIEIWRTAARFSPSAGSEVAFITMVARRRLIDRFRKRQRTVPTSPLNEALTEPANREVDRVELCDEAARAAAELAQLRPEERRVLELSIYHGLTHEHIATVTGLPLGTVKTNARRGLIRLRDKLAGSAVPTAAGGMR
jgi:RNA polymerase sigma factor (sigma-70 family)